MCLRDDLSRSAGAEAKTYLVIRLYLIVVSWVGESKRKHALLLEVGLVDASKAASDDGKAAEMARFQSGMFSRRSLAVVPVSNHDPLDPLLLVVAGDSRHGIELTRGLVLDLVRLAVSLVDGTDQHVVGDVVQMAAIAEPRAGHGDVVCRRLPLGLDEDLAVESVLTIPGSEGLQDLEAVRRRRHLHAHGRAVLGGCLVCVLARVVAASREALARGRREQELVAVLVLELVGERVEVEAAGNGHGHDEVGRRHERVRSGVAVVPAGEVPVVRRDDRVRLALLDVASVPLADARAAGIGENDTTKLLERLQLAVPRKESTKQHQTKKHRKRSQNQEAENQGVARDRGGT